MQAISITSSPSDMREITEGELALISGGDGLISHVITSAGQGAAAGAHYSPVGAVVGGVVGAVVGFIAHMLE